MTDRYTLLGAIVGISILCLCILIFIFRLAGLKSVESWLGILVILAGIPLVYLLLTAPRLDRPAIYYIQIGLMLLYLVIELLLDYLFRLDFRHTRWMTVSYVTLFFAATGGMIGVISLAGKTWTILAVALFLVMAALSIYQRAKTGL